MAGKPPVTVFRSGTVSLKVWEDEVEVQGMKHTTLSFTVERRYRKSNDAEEGKNSDNKVKWESSTSFFARDLLEIALLCQRVYEGHAVKVWHRNDEARPEVSKTPAGAAAEETKRSNESPL